MNLYWNNQALQGGPLTHLNSFQTYFTFLLSICIPILRIARIDIMVVCT